MSLFCRHERMAIIAMTGIPSFSVLLKNTGFIRKPMPIKSSSVSQKKLLSVLIIRKVLIAKSDFRLAVKRQGQLLNSGSPVWMRSRYCSGQVLSRSLFKTLFPSLSYTGKSVGMRIKPGIPSLFSTCDSSGRVIPLR